MHADIITYSLDLPGRLSPRGAARGRIGGQMGGCTGAYGVYMRMCTGVYLCRVYTGWRMGASPTPTSIQRGRIRT